MEVAEDAPSPRLCHLVKWPDFDGYGFNLHAEKAKTGQYIGKVDDNSPAQLAGLREGDRIIEVNLVNISNENHRQVVERIKSVPNETKLLVIDDASDRWYKERKLVVKSSQSNVIYCKTPVPRPNADTNGDTNGDIIGHIAHTNGDNTESDTNESNTETNTESSAEANTEANTEPKTNGSQESEMIHKTTVNTVNGSPIMTESSHLENGAISSGSSTPQSIPRSQSVNSEAIQNNRPSSGGSNTNISIPDSPISSKSGSSNGVARSLSDSGGDLNLNMSASEMRQILAQRKKHDAKKAQIDLRQKYEIIQQM